MRPLAARLREANKTYLVVGTGLAALGAYSLLSMVVGLVETSSSVFGVILIAGGGPLTALAALGVALVGLGLRDQ